MEPFLAEIRIFPFNYAPNNWASCNGQVMPISQNTALFSLLGTTYGGNGFTTFALPNLQGNVPMSFGAGPGLTPRDLGEVGGSLQATINTGSMPAHTHPLMAAAPPATLNAPSNTTSLARSSGGTVYSASNASLKEMDKSAISDFAGGNQPHNNVQPYLALNFCIALSGIFPQRS